MRKLTTTMTRYLPWTFSRRRGCLSDCSGDLIQPQLQHNLMYDVLLYAIHACKNLPPALHHLICKLQNYSEIRYSTPYLTLKVNILVSRNPDDPDPVQCKAGKHAQWYCRAHLVICGLSGSNHCRMPTHCAWWCKPLPDHGMMAEAYQIMAKLYQIMALWQNKAGVAQSAAGTIWSTS